MQSSSSIELPCIIYGPEKEVLHVCSIRCYLGAQCTVKLVRAKLPANAGNFTCSSQVKRSLRQFTCVTCSLPVNTGKFTCFEAASTSRRTHANCLRAQVNFRQLRAETAGKRYLRRFLPASASVYTCGSVYLRPSQVNLHAPVLQCVENMQLVLAILH